MSHRPQGWIPPATVTGSPSSPPFDTRAGEIQERDPCAIIVRIRARSHSIPAAWVGAGCVGAGPCNCPERPKSGKLLRRLIQALSHLYFRASEERTGLSFSPQRQLLTQILFQCDQLLFPSPAKPLATLAMGSGRCTHRLLGTFQRPGFLQLLFPDEDSSLSDAARERQQEEKHQAVTDLTCFFSCNQVGVIQR